MPADFEKWLSEELHSQLDPLKSMPTNTHPWYRRVGMQSWNRPLSKLPVTAVRGLVVAGLIAAFSTTGSFALAAAATHSANPLVWGQQVQSAVQSCQSQLASGQHGIGDCVSDFASTNGVTQPDQHSPHSQSSSTPHPTAHSSEGDSQGGEHGDKGASPESHPTGSPESHSTESSQATQSPSSGQPD